MLILVHNFVGGATKPVTCILKHKTNVQDTINDKSLIVIICNTDSLSLTICSLLNICRWVCIYVRIVKYNVIFQSWIFMRKTHFLPKLELPDLVIPARICCSVVFFLFVCMFYFLSIPSNNWKTIPPLHVFNSFVIHN